MTSDAAAKAVLRQSKRDAEWCFRGLEGRWPDVDGVLLRGEGFRPPRGGMASGERAVVSRSGGMAVVVSERALSGQ